MTAAQEAGHTARFEIFDPTPNANSDDYQDRNTERSEERQSEERQQVQVERPRINIEKPKRREV